MASTTELKVIKHAEATAAQLILKTTDKSINIQIKDNGKGFDPELAIATSKSLGLRTMQERIKNIGGKLNFLKGEQRGSIVDIELPVS